MKLSKKKKWASLIAAILIAVGTYFGIPTTTTTPVANVTAEVVVDLAAPTAPMPLDATCTDGN